LKLNLIGSPRERDGAAANPETRRTERQRGHLAAAPGQRDPHPVLHEEQRIDRPVRALRERPLQPHDPRLFRLGRTRQAKAGDRRQPFDANRADNRAHADKARFQPQPRSRIRVQERVHRGGGIDLQPHRLAVDRRLDDIVLPDHDLVRRRPRGTRLCRHHDQDEACMSSQHVKRPSPCRCHRRQVY